MWSNVKSWWYWKVSSKFDIVDIVFALWIPVFCGSILWGIISENNRAESFNQQCSIKNGVMVQGYNEYLCVDKQAIR